MAIARRPNSSRASVPPATQERAAEAFIQGAAKPRLETIEGGRKTPIMLRFDATLLHRVDSAARRRGISRSAWIAFKVSEALDAEET